VKITIAAVGKLRRGPYADLCDDYIGRGQNLARGLGLSGPVLIEVEAPKSLSGDALKAREGELLINAVPEKATIFLLDEHGKNLSSVGLKTELQHCRETNIPEIAFIIGGADGLSDELKRRAVKTFAFGAATWPHMLVRVMLTEQIYRAMTIMTGHPYHRV